MKTMKRTLAVLLCALLLVGIVPFGAFATGADTTDSPNSDTETNVEGNSGFGYILNNLEQTNVDETNSDCSVLNIKMNGKTATVYFETPKKCKLVVAVYDDTNREHMLASGMTDIDADASTAEVEIDIDALPQYYFIKAFMLNEDLSALSSPFSFYEHTSAYEQFMAVTPDDFNADRIVAFGENPEESFGALTEDVVVPQAAAGMTYTYDENAGTYTFQNASEDIKSLSAGDVVYYETADDFVLAKVDSITVSGNTVTIKEDEDISIDDAFDYVRFDEGGYFDDFDEDSIETGEAVEVEDFEYMDADDYDFNANPYASKQNAPKRAKSSEDYGDEGSDVKGQIISTTLSIDYPGKKTTDPKEQKWLSMGIKVTGSLGYTLGASARLHWDIKIGPDYFEYKVEVESKIEFSISVTGTIEVNKEKVYWDVGKTLGQKDGFKLGKTGFFRLYVKVYPIASFSGKLDIFKITLLQLKGAKINSDDGYKNISSDNKWVDTPDFLNWEIEIKLGVGIEFEISPKKGKKKEDSKKLIASISLSVEAYLDLKFSPDDVGTLAHDCSFCMTGPAKFCIDGDVTIKLKIFKLLKKIKKKSIKKYVNENGKFEMTLLSLSWSKDLGACYLSRRNGNIKLGFGECPYKKTTVTVYAYDAANNNQGVKDAVISYNGTSGNTNAQGVLVIYLAPHKTYTIQATYNGVTLTKSVDVSELEKSVTFTFNGTEDPNNPTDPDDPLNAGHSDGIGSADDLSNGGTQGGIIQFGAYPQTKETDSATISDLNSLAGDWHSYGYYSGTGSYSDGQMTAKDYMMYCDVKYGGSKYRGVKFDTYRPYYTGYTSSSNYQQTNGYTTGTTYWFKYEPLQWKVLDLSEGLVMCVSLIDSQPYNNYILSSGKDPHNHTAYWGDAGKTYYANDYENSSLRHWLTHDFYATAFTQVQQDKIDANRDQNNDCYYTLTGNMNYTDYDSDPTNDKIFLLSYADVINPAYGFASSNSTYDTARQAKGTDYAKCQGLLNGSEGDSWWWLRSPGDYSLHACCVDRGYAYSGYYVSNANGGIRPACKISNLSGSADGTGSDDDFSNGGTQGGIIQFGAYPQTKETDSATISDLNSLASDWHSYGYYSGSGSWADGQMTAKDYMMYCDVKYGGSKYRGVKFDDYRPHHTGYMSSSNLQWTNGYTTGTTYWFKYEPLQWKVLDPSEGLVMCVSLIDSQPYNNYVLENGTDPHGKSAYWGDAGETYYASDYENSSLRHWLIHDFYVTAFTQVQQDKIDANRDQNNDCYYTLNGIADYTDYDSNQTNDKIFLLSYDEVLNASYGFAPSSSTYDTARQARGTDYAKCQGLHVFDGSSYKGMSSWWLRSSHVLGDACDVEYRGDLFIDVVSHTCNGIRPACKISNLASGISKSSNPARKAAPAAKAVAETGTGIYQYSYTACVAGNDYILLNVTGYGSDFTLTTQNLEYIDQLTADETGKVSGTFLPRNAVSGSTTLLIGDFGSGTEARQLNATEHTHTYTWTDLNDATCIANGHRKGVCGVCGNEVAEEIPDTATGHTETDWIYPDGFDCEMGGVRYKECTVCHQMIMLETLEGRPHTYTSTITTAPTCTTDGETTYTCSVCGDTYTEPIPATGDHVDADNDGHCDTCEQQMTGGDHCKYCGKIHDGFFGWLVKFFHSIFAIFKR